jgi:hypothetical protein
VRRDRFEAAFDVQSLGVQCLNQVKRRRIKSGAIFGDNHV